MFQQGSIRPQKDVGIDSYCRVLIYNIYRKCVIPLRVDAYRRTPFWQLLR